MVMDPRTHPRGARPDFTLPAPNPNPGRMTDALWWLICMRDLLEPASQNGGSYANKPGYHNAGENLPDHGEGNLKTDHSIRRAPDRTGAWWRKYCAAHDWTFPDAQQGKYGTISKYTKRLVDSMKSLTDTRPDDVYAYTIGQIDGDRAVEGWNEYKDEPETGDESHLWHRHDSFRRNIIGSFWHMWKALTIDMGWSYQDWMNSIKEDEVALSADDKKFINDLVGNLQTSLEAKLAALTKTGQLNGPDGKPDGTQTTPIGSAALSQGIPNPFNDGKRSPAWLVIGDIASHVKALEGPKPTT